MSTLSHNFSHVRLSQIDSQHTNARQINTCEINACRVAHAISTAGMTAAAKFNQAPLAMAALSNIVSFAAMLGGVSALLARLVRKIYACVQGSYDCGIHDCGVRDCEDDAIRPHKVAGTQSKPVLRIGPGGEYAKDFVPMVSARFAHIATGNSVGNSAGKLDGKLAGKILGNVASNSAGNVLKVIAHTRLVRVSAVGPFQANTAIDTANLVHSEISNQLGVHVGEWAAALSLMHRQARVLELSRWRLQGIVAFAKGSSALSVVASGGRNASHADIRPSSLAGPLWQLGTSLAGTNLAGTNLVGMRGTKLGRDASAINTNASRSKLGSSTASTNGSQAGSQPGSKAGSQAGSKAGSQAGSQVNAPASRTFFEHSSCKQTNLDSSSFDQSSLNHASFDSTSLDSQHLERMNDHESYSQATSHSSTHTRRTNPQGVLPNDAGARGPDRREQGHGLRARGSPDQEGRTDARAQQGSLFVDR